MHKFIRYWLPLLVYAVCILVASLWLRGPASLVKVFGDKPLHALEYGLLAVLALRALGHGLNLEMRWATIGSLVLVAGFGTIDELVQSLNPARSPDPLDVAADALGGLVGAALYLLLKRLFRKVVKPAVQSD